jgi:hypothetical protein
MAATLVPCPSCRRHVLTREDTCPFCSAALPAQAAAPSLPETTRRLSRAQIFAFATSVGVTASLGCSTTSSTPVYGAPFPETGVDANADVHDGIAPDADAGPDDTGGTSPLYGDPAPDTGSDG